MRKEGAVQSQVKAIDFKTADAQLESLPINGLGLLSIKLRNLLLCSYGAFPTMEVVAKSMGMSGRTLRRRLLDEGFSYQKVLNNVRTQLAKELLSNSKESITNIAVSLGFSDSSSFTKAFKRWAGQTPREFRNTRHGGVKVSKSVENLTKL